MKVKTTLETEDDDDFTMIERIFRMLSEDEVGTMSEELSTDFSEEHEYVLRTLRENPGGYARKVIHKRAARLDGSPFTEPDEDGEERSRVGSILWQLERLNLAHHNGNRWYPELGDATLLKG